MTLGGSQPLFKGWRQFLIPGGTLRGLPSSTNRAWISSESRATSKASLICLGNLGMVVYSQGDLGRAAKLTEEAVALLRELGSQRRRLYRTLQPRVDGPAPRRS